jgi:hypothetical protein
MLKSSIDIGAIQDEAQKKYVQQKLPSSFSTVQEAELALKDLKKHEKATKVKLDEVHELLLEIIDDMKWIKDKKNSIVLWVDKSAKRIEALVRKKFKVDNVMIRAHVSKRHLVVMGKFEAQLSQDIEEYVTRISGYKSLVHVAGI